MLRSLSIFCIVTALAGCATTRDDGRPVTDAETTRVAGAPQGAIRVFDMVGRDSIVQVHTTDVGTRYTLCSTTGEALVRHIDARELSRLRPDLDPHGMQADWGHGPLMLADFDR